MTDQPENILDILKTLCPDLDLEAFQAVAGGRQWYVPSTRRQSMARTRELIRLDPCRDYKVIMRRYKVSVALVYSVWNEKTG